MRTGKSAQLTRRLVRRRQSACDRRKVGGRWASSFLSWQFYVMGQDLASHIEAVLLMITQIILLLEADSWESRAGV